MTPCVKKPKVASNNSNYNIDDLNSDDSTDDETRPRKKIPYWAQGQSVLLRCFLFAIHLLTSK